MELYNILDDCLERVMKGGETLEQCLARYPEHAAELESLLTTAQVAKEATDVRPRAEFRERAGYQFLAAVREARAKKNRSFFSWQPRWAISTAVVVVLLLAGGTVALANNSLPGEPLYQVKLATETVRVAMTPSDLGKAELYVKLADRRVSEIIEMADEGKLQELDQTTRRLNDELAAISSLDLPATGASEGAVDVLQAPEPQTAEGAKAPQLAAPPPSPEPAPAPAEPGYRTPDASGPDINTEQPAAEPSGETPMFSTAPEAGAQPEIASAAPEGENKSTELDDDADLKAVLSSRAVSNTIALQEALQRVPESARPALQRAIEQAMAGYEQALQNLD